MESLQIPLNFNQLRLFLAVAHHGAVTRAAEAISISQPAVSKAVKELERELGVPLLEPRGRGVALTEAGETLASYAQGIFTLADEARRAMDELRGLERGRLAIGASTTIGNYLLPRIMGQYHVRYPRIDISLEIGNTEQIIDRLKLGALDMALVEGPVSGNDVRVEPFFRDELVLIAAPEHPFALAGQVALDDLNDAPFLIREHGSGTRVVIESVLAQFGVSLNVAMELGHTEAIKQAVAANLGVSILSRLTVEHEIRAGLLTAVAVSGLEFSRPFLLVQRQRSRPASSGGPFLQLLSELGAV